MACEVDGCVQIMVPIEYPKGCSADDVQCILANIATLDDEAQAQHALSAATKDRDILSPTEQVRDDF